jgi:hypothetical protein
VELAGEDSYQPGTVHEYLLSTSAKKAEERRMKSGAFNLISSPTRYFNTDLAGSNLIVLSAHILLLLFIIELHNILTSFGGLPSVFLGPGPMNKIAIQGQNHVVEEVRSKASIAALSRRSSIVV